MSIKYINIEGQEKFIPVGDLLMSHVAIIIDSLEEQDILFEYVGE